MAANAIGLFKHSGGIQANAGKGPVPLHAHTDQLKILADKAVTIISVNDVIEIKASQKIVLQAGQSSVTLEGGDITFACPGNFTVKGGQHVFDGGAGVAPALPPLPTQLAAVLNPEQMIRQAGTHSLRFAFAGSNDVADFMGLVDAPYKIRDDTGATLAQGKVGKDGRLPRQDFPKGKELTLQVGEDTWKSVTGEPSSAPTASATEDDANAQHVDDDPYFDAALDDDSVHLDADILAYLIQHPEGEA